mgnify:FL=1
MSYIGTPPSNAFTSLLKQDFSTSATTGYTLDHAVNNANDIALFINFVRQEPTAGYAASGTTLTLTSATASSDDMYCVYLGQALQTVNPANGSVGTAQLIDGAVTSAKLASGTGGKILQVVTATDSTARTTTSTSYVTASSSLSINITPASTSNKIFLICNTPVKESLNGETFLGTIFRDSTDIGGNGLGLHYQEASSNIRFPMTMCVLDSPSSSSQITYTARFKTSGGTATINEGNRTGTLTAFEVGA